MKKQVSVKEIDEREMFYRKLEESRRQYKEGKVSSAEDVFKELRDKYGY